MRFGTSHWHLGILACLLLLLCACQKASLLEGLEEHQANEVIGVMLHHNIAAHKLSAGKGGFSVQVSAADLSQAIDLVRQHSLPTPVRTKISDAFPADAMVSTPLGERARLFSAIEQRLEESLAALNGVRTARVDVSYDLRSASSISRDSMSNDMRLAAVIVHEPGTDEQALVQSAKRFLRNTFANVGYDNISVVLATAPPARVLMTTSGERSATRFSWLWVVLGVMLLAMLGVCAVWAYRHGRLGGVIQGKTLVRKLMPQPKGLPAGQLEQQ